MAPHRLTRRQARRIAVRAQLLDAPRRDDLLDVVRHLAMLQADPTNAVAPNADLVLWSRLGSAHRFGELADAFERGDVIEIGGILRPAEDIELFRAQMESWPGPDPSEWRQDLVDWIEANDECRRDIIELLERDGPLPSKAFPDTTIVPWRSSGWNNNRSVRMLIGLLEERGEIAVAGYRGRDRLWDLAERVFPDDPALPLDEAGRIRNERRLHALGIARATATEVPTEQNYVGETGEPAVVDGVRGTWRVDPAYLDSDFDGRTAIISPLDRLIFDRKRMGEIFEFDYQLEMYKPAAKRRWGYWAMPILDGDRLVGKVDAATDRVAGALRVAAIHEDEPFSRALRKRVEAELRDLAAWLGVEPILPLA